MGGLKIVISATRRWWTGRQHGPARPALMVDWVARALVAGYPW
jgi:hypothetical protein